jgi:hypothetical protein
VLLARRPAALVLLSWTCAAAQVTDPTAAMQWDDSLLLVVKSARLTDNGDNDGFADPHETVNVFLTLRNVSDLPLSGIVVALVTGDPRVDCRAHSPSSRSGRSVRGRRAKRRCR